MENEREGIGLPSSLVNEAINSMNPDSHTASNSPIDPATRIEESGANHVAMGGDNSFNEDSRPSFTEIDTIDSNRGSNVDRSNSFDRFDSSNDQPMNSGLISDTRGSMAMSPVMAEQVGQIDFVKWFSELKKEDVASAGGKGSSLGEMFTNKFPVPPGYVITAQAYDLYLKESRLHEQIDSIIGGLDVDDTAALNEASKKIRQLIEGGKMSNELREEILESYKILSSEDLGEINPGVNSDALSILKNSQEPIFVSVRSSATTEDLVDASFAGQQESFLNVKGDHDLIEFVKRCFSSLYTPRAIFYRKKKGFSGALIAVVIQKMVDSEKSGVVFSRDPVKQDDNIAMEAVFGLGEGIVSGKIHPDNYIVDRELEIKNIKVANKKIAIVRTSAGKNETVRLSPEKSESQVLSRAEIKEVADFAMKLEDHYQKPQDIEFAIDAGEVYIIQSRPITTLGNKQEGKELKGNVIVEGLAASPGVGVGTVRLIKNMEDLVNIKKGDVMVTEMTNPDMVVSMEKSVAIVTDEGGMTSHAAIVSREMGIPAIVGCGDATTKLKDGMKITVDGFNGKVFEGEVAETTMVEIKEAVKTEKVKLKVIVDLPDYAERAAESGIDSIGLTRLEGMIASMGKHPLWYEKQGKLEDYSKILQEGLGKIIKPFKSMWVRASDIRTDEFASLEGAPEREINPMLGFHGVRFSVKHPEILKAEIAAIKEVAEHNPDKKIGLMFPQIISMEEVLTVKKYFDEFRTDNMEFGVMIETPAAVQIIEDICDHVDFISFGTNDLTQFTLAVDRGEDSVQHLYNELHPAIFSQIGYVIDVCNKKNVVSSICGQAGSKPEMAKFLFEKGITSISVNADAALEISEVIVELEKNEIESSNTENSIEETREESPVLVESPVVVEVPEVVKEEPKQEESHEWGTKGQVSIAEVAPVVEAPKEESVAESVVETPSLESVEKPVVETPKESIDKPVEGTQESQSLGDNNSGELSDEERKALKKKKKWEKFKRWKERKKADKAAKRIEREAEEAKNGGASEEVQDGRTENVEPVAEQVSEPVSEPVEEPVVKQVSEPASEVQDDNTKHGWGKQGEVALPDSNHAQVVEKPVEEKREEVSVQDSVENEENSMNQDKMHKDDSGRIPINNVNVQEEKQEIAKEIKQDEKQFNEEVQEENPYEDNLLNPDNISVSAESHVEGPEASDEVDNSVVDKIDDLSYVEEKSEEIAEDVKEHNEDVLDEMQEVRDHIEVTSETPEEIKVDENIERFEESHKDEYGKITLEHPDTLAEKDLNAYVDSAVESDKIMDSDSIEDEPNVLVVEEPDEVREIGEEIGKIVGSEIQDNGEKEFGDDVPEVRADGVEELSESEEDDQNESESGENEVSDGESEESGVSGDGGEEFNEIGVYNPDDGGDKKEEKSKYNYNFEDWD